MPPSQFISSSLMMIGVLVTNNEAGTWRLGHVQAGRVVFVVIWSFLDPRSWCQRIVYVFVSINCCVCIYGEGTGSRERNSRSMYRMAARPVGACAPCSGGVGCHTQGGTSREGVACAAMTKQ